MTLTAPLHSELLDRIPPHNADAERGVIGSILIDPRVMDTVADMVRASDFYDRRHQKLFSTLSTMHNRRQRIDAVLVLDVLRRERAIDEIGGTAYVAEVLQAVPYAANATYYAGIVKERSQRRAIIDAAQDALRAAWDEAVPFEETLSNTERALSEISVGATGSEIVTAEQAAIRASEHIDKIFRREEQAGLPTGLIEFDTKIGGLFPGELIVLAARAGIGKTSLAAQIVQHNGSRDRLVLMASIEMDAAELTTRMLCCNSGVSNRDIRTNRLTHDHMRLLAESSADFGNYKIVFDESPEQSVSSVRRVARRLLSQGLRLVVVDYLQILDPEDERVSREQQVARMSKGLKALSRELKLPVLVLCQTNREAEKDKVVSLRHLRESDAIGQNADVVLILEVEPITADNYQTPDKRIRDAFSATLNVAKNRNGPKGEIPLEWIPSRTLFVCHEPEAREMSNYDPSFESGGSSDDF